jgi:hypothetical protein
MTKVKTRQEETLIRKDKNMKIHLAFVVVKRASHKPGKQDKAR